jgi:hypothetical protein
MVAKNDITGDAIQSKINSKEYGDNFDRIFRKDKVVQPEPAADQPVELWTEDDEKRLDIVGQNGPVGYNLEDIYAEGDKDYGAR